MAAPVYADTTDLASAPWNVDPIPGNSALMLAAASRQVRQATLAAYYRVGSDNLPTDPVVRTAFKEATCAQVVAWIAQKIDPMLGSAQATQAAITSKGIGSARISRDSATAAKIEEARSYLATSLGPAALNILLDAGLNTFPGTIR